MSYDLFFYKHKGSEISTEKISKYLIDNLVQPNEGNNQWFYENEDTEVYFSFEFNEVEEDFETDDEIVPIENFDDTNFTFNLNFMRPSFFGQEAFQFVEQFCIDLNLYVLNPQGDSENPYKPKQKEQFDNWNKTNLWASKDHFKEMECSYMNENETNQIWHFNSNRKSIQDKLGEQYFVPKIFFFKTKHNNEPFTLTIWTEHIPIVLPTTDYILLTRQYKKFFRTVKDTVLISRNELLENFGNEFENFDFPNCKIIHQNKADKLKDKFNSIKSDKKLETFADRIPMENLYNAKPE
jgi:hypothetical protein